MDDAAKEDGREKGKKKMKERAERKGNGGRRARGRWQVLHGRRDTATVRDARLNSAIGSWGEGTFSEPDSHLCQ